MWNLKYLVLLTTVIYYTDTSRLPSYLEKCCAGPTMNTCVLQMANKAIAAMFKGDEIFNIPNFLPLTVPKIVVLDNTLGHFVLQSVQIFGLAGVKITNFSYDMSSGQGHAQYTLSECQIQGSYDMQLANTPVVGFGHATLRLYDLNINHVWVALVDNEGYLRMRNPSAYVTIPNVGYDMDNMSPIGNDFLNQNQQLLAELFIPGVNEFITDLCTWCFASIGALVKLTDLCDFNCPNTTSTTASSLQC